MIISRYVNPYLDGNELKYVTDAVKTGWVSYSGNYISAFENSFANYCGVKYTVTTCNGIAALHLAMLALDIGKGDKVIIHCFTMIASALAVCYSGATPVFADATHSDWNIDTEKGDYNKF